MSISQDYKVTVDKTSHITVLDVQVPTKRTPNRDCGIYNRGAFNSSRTASSAVAVCLAGDCLGTTP